MMNPAVAQHFLETLFGHELLKEVSIGTSAFPPRHGRHAWHASPVEAAVWGLGQASTANVYFRTTPVLRPPEKGRGDATIASAIVGFHADIDIAHPVHKIGNLPPNEEIARKIVDLVGLTPTLLVHSGHGLQPHWLLAEPWIFGEADLEAATAMVKRFGATVQASARSTGFRVDTVADLARILRLPGTVNRKAEPVPVTILEEGGPRYALSDVEAVLVDEMLGASDVPRVVIAGEGAVGVPGDSPEPGFPGSDDELLNAARRSKSGDAFSALFDRGELSSHHNDDSLADWHLVGDLAFWSGPNAERIDRLFRRSRLMRVKWDQVHGADGRTYGQITIAKALEKKSCFFTPRRPLPQIIVNDAQLRDQTAEALAALHRNNSPPHLFQRHGALVRVRVDPTTGASSVQELTVDAVVGELTRSADYLRATERGFTAVRPPESIARDLLSRPSWNLPTLVGVVDSPRVRPDGTILLKPGYDPATKLLLTPYAGWEGFEVPDDPTPAQIDGAKVLIRELLHDFPFSSPIDFANAVGFMLTPILRPAIQGFVPFCAVDALSRQGTGKGLLVRTCMIVATGKDPPMCVIASDEAERAKSLTSLLLTGRELIIFDNAVGSVLDSPSWATALTADIYSDRVLGFSKRADVYSRCTWAITGNGMNFGGDLVRRVYLVLLDAKMERPEDRGEFLHPLPSWAFERRLELLRACLILCRSWWANGCPMPRIPKWGSFEAFTETVGGVLENIGIPGFLGNRAVFREAADVERHESTTFLLGIATAIGEGVPFSAAGLVEKIEHEEVLRAALPARLRDALERKTAFSTRLGIALRTHTGAVFGDLRLASAGRDTHAKRPLFCVGRAEKAIEVAGGRGTPREVA